ncbi:MAG: ATP-binding protein [Bacteroidota bacterium]|nr:ATP-binding protein [Bacteroidota bacterium]MDP4258919.1 ATP-binding protein [Bacteroidota bacterium]
MPVRKVVIIGPESTGKSTLCEELAAHFAASGRPSGWVPEFAREYLLAHGMNYSYADLLTIAKGQLALEDRCAAALASSAPPPEAPHPGAPPSSAPLLFIDTDLYVLKVWCEFVFGKCHAWILEQIAARHYDAYLLCRTDLPWVRDELREYPDLITREKLFLIYKDCMINQATPWAEVGGPANERTANGVAAVSALMAGGSLQ